MPTYEFRFMKSLPDDTGHIHVACQDRMVIQASDEARALRTATKRFCRDKGIANWPIFADFIELHHAVRREPPL